MFRKSFIEFQTMGEEGFYVFSTISRVLIPDLIAIKAVHPQFFNNLKNEIS